MKLGNGDILRERKKISTTLRQADFHSHNCLDSTNFKKDEIFNFVRFQKIKRSGTKWSASGTRHCLPKALTGRQRPKHTIGAFNFGILKFF